MSLWGCPVRRKSEVHFNTELMSDLSGDFFNYRRLVERAGCLGSAYRGRFAKDRNPRHSRRSILSATWASRPKWRAFDNELAGGLFHRRRRPHPPPLFGEGDYALSERVIQDLLAEARKGNLPAGVVPVSATGAEAASDDSDCRMCSGSSPAFRWSRRTFASGRPHQRFVNRWTDDG